MEHNLTEGEGEWFHSVACFTGEHNAIKLGAPFIKVLEIVLDMHYGRV